MMKWWEIVLIVYGSLVFLMALFSTVVYFINKDKPFVYRNEEGLQ